LVQDLDELTARLRAAGYDVKDDKSIEDYNRVYVDDPFGNRLELIERVEGRRLRTC
jgi:hypothetical protein